MHQSDDNAHNVQKMPLVLIVYTILGTLIGLILLFVCSVLVARELLPERMVSAIPGICAFLGALCSGFFSARVLGRALLTGLVQGLVSFAVLYVMGLLVFMRIVPEAVNPIVFLACMAGGVLGGIFSAGRRRRRA